jgi:hypothetical protein
VNDVEQIIAVLIVGALIVGGVVALIMSNRGGDE